MAVKSEVWNRFPLFKLLIPFMLGIISAIHGFLAISLEQLLIGGGSLFLLLIFSTFIRQYQFRWFYGFIAIFLIFILGYSLVVAEQEKLRKNSSSFPDDSGIWLVETLESPVEKKNSYKLKVLVLRKDSSDKRDQKAILYFEKDSFLASQISYGMQLVVHTTWQRPSAPANPAQFNYRQYLERSGITHQAYARRQDIRIPAQSPKTDLRGWIFNLREQLLANLRHHGLKGDEYSLASAILLGKDDSMDPRLRSGFATAGAMHILCVSGLHVGVIFLILDQLLKFLNRRKRGPQIKAVILILMIWFYAALTGLEPSVLRASTMVSFVVIGRTIKRPGSVYNSLAASALLLLIFDPLIITQIGFQLSYLAVLAIVAFQPLIYKLWLPKNRILDKVWAIITVSVAAQLGTFALAIHYFHIFPVYFLLTNLIVIPLSSLIIYSGFLVFISMPLPPVSWLFAKVLYGLLWFLKNSVFVIESLPSASLDYLGLTGGQVILLMLFLLFVYFWLVTANRQPVFFALGVFLILMISFINQKIENLNNQELIIYDAGKGLAIEAIDGYQHVLLADSTVNQNEDFIRYNVREYWMKRGLKPAKMQLWEDKRPIHYDYLWKSTDDMIVWKDTLLYVLNDKRISLAKAPDILLVHHRQALPDCLQGEQPPRIILTGKVPPWNQKKWLDYGKQQGIPVEKLEDGFIRLK